jgi:hypothetical protein
MDLLEGTVSAWYEAITFKKAWHPSDAVRFQTAFSRLMENSTEWPTPKQFLESIPRDKATLERCADAALLMHEPEPLLRVPQNQERIQQEIDKCARKLGVDLSVPRDKKPPNDYREAPERPWGVDLDEWDSATKTVTPKPRRDDSEN